MGETCKCDPTTGLLPKGVTVRVSIHGENGNRLGHHDVVTFSTIDEADRYAEAMATENRIPEPDRKQGGH